jgi:hypothetical protein
MVNAAFLGLVVLIGMSGCLGPGTFQRAWCQSPDTICGPRTTSVVVHPIQTATPEQIAEARRDLGLTQ